MRRLLKTSQLALFILVILVSSCKKDKDAAGVLVKFINSTGKDLIQVKVDDQIIGSIKKGDNTGYIRFDKFGVDTGMPDAAFVAVVDGAEIGCTSKFYWCGTEKSNLAYGRYEVYVRIVNVGNSSYLDLRFY